MITNRRLLLLTGALLTTPVLVGLLLPSVARVERTVSIDAPAATLHALSNDFRKRSLWSMWTELDPNVRLEWVGPVRGVGASIEWSGKLVGRGQQTIVESIPATKVVTRIEYEQSAPAQSSVEFDANAGDNATIVRLRLERDFGFDLFGRYSGMFLDRAVGKGLEAGLARLKDLAERLPPIDFADLSVEHLVVEATDIAYLETSSEPLARAISAALGDAYFRVLGFVDRHDLRETGAPISISRTYDGAELRFDAAVPIRGVKADTPLEDGQVRIGKTYGGPVIRVKHSGPYLELSRTHAKIAAYLAAAGLRRNGDAWEAYVSDPTHTSGDDLLTYVYYPVEQEL